MPCPSLLLCGNERRSSEGTAGRIWERAAALHEGLNIVVVSCFESAVAERSGHFRLLIVPLCFQTKDRAICLNRQSELSNTCAFRRGRHPAAGAWQQAHTAGTFVCAITPALMRPKTRYFERSEYAFDRSAFNALLSCQAQFGNSVVSF